MLAKRAKGKKKENNGDSIHGDGENQKYGNCWFLDETYQSFVYICPRSFTVIMDAILKKMNFKEGMKIRIWNEPKELEPLFADWSKAGFMADSSEKPAFMVAFVQSEGEVEKIFPELNALVDGDGLVWMAYPKGTSKKYKAQINRDSGWKILKDSGYETVRQIAIDEDWSALRFRKLEFIKSLTRSSSPQNL